MVQKPREDPVKELARWLTVGIHQLNGWRKSFAGDLKIFIILPASVFFCLTLQACDIPEEPSGSLVETPNISSPIPPAQRPEQAAHGNTQSKTELPRIVAFGDSLTAGLGVAQEEAYPDQLERWVREQGLAYQVINAGVSGDTSAGGLRRVGWILKSRPSMVIVELGANDGLRGQPLNETFNNLDAIITILKDKGVIVVLAGMRIPLNYGEDYTREFSDLYVRLAQKHDVSFIPFFLEGVATHRQLNQGDGLHPNAEGYSIVVQNVWSVIEPILRGLAQAE